MLIPTDVSEVRETISSLKSISSFGIDEISVAGTSMLSAPIAHWVILIFKEGPFPDQMKAAIVIPLHKGNDIKII
ncbi:hypothetical protein HHI36_002681, partial [Cryptolaemus montrouzieri]